jgi:hypothetical protein
MQALWSKKSIPFPQERLWLSVHRLLDLAASIPEMPAQWLWTQFSIADPLYLSRARLILASGDTGGMVRLLEDHWPSDRDDQHAVRQALIAWLPAHLQLPYRIADCLETGSLEGLAEMKDRLSENDWNELALTFTRRWPQKTSDAQ